MSKEDKPLEYQGRIRDTKGVAQRLDLDYLKRKSWLPALRGKLAWALLVAAVLACLPLVLGLGGSRKMVANGPVSEAHAMFAGRCEVCHAQNFGGVPDNACQRCHDGAPHPAKSIDMAKATATPACADCHLEHRGKAMLAEVGSGNCTSCHSDLTAHASGVRLKANSITAFRESKHPEFSTATATDTRPLKLNHAAHMPAQPKTIRGMKLPMKCGDCHVTDRNSATGALLPVTFDRNCKQCHARELEFDVYHVLGNDAPPAPHTKDPEAIRAFITKAYWDAVQANPGLARKPLTNELMPAAMWMQRVVADSDRYLFERKCVYCHEMEGPSTVRKVNAIQGRHDGQAWFPRAEFAHRKHRAVECESCHATARKSSKTEDVLIPAMKTCLPCHGGSSAGLDRCSLCHVYHNRGLEKDRERRGTEELVGGGAMKFFGASDPGRKRSNNEDAWTVEDDLHVAILADGMGGESCGEVASAVTIEGVLAYLRAPEAGLSPEELAKEAIREANRKVIECAAQRQECDGMGSTVVVVLWRGASAVIANAGDSRAYLYRGGELRQVTYDQNFANELRTRLGFSEERLLAMPNRNVLTMAVGTFEQILTRTQLEELRAGDQILLCSDGLHGPVDERTIAGCLAGAGSLQQKVEYLIAAANEAGGPDNVTAVLLQYGNEGNG